MKTAQLIAARMAHDLSASASAAGMGFSVLQESPTDAQAFDITAQSIHNLQATLTFLRALFALEGPLPWPHMSRILIPYAKTRDTIITVQNTSMPQLWASILPYLCLIAMDAFTGSKKLNIQWNDSALRLHCEGHHYVLPQETLNILGQKQDLNTFTPASIHLYILNTHLCQHKLYIQAQAHAHTLDLIVDSGA